MNTCSLPNPCRPSGFLNFFRRLETHVFTGQEKPIYCRPFSTSIWAACSPCHTRLKRARGQTTSKDVYAALAATQSVHLGWLQNHIHLMEHSILPMYFFLTNTARAVTNVMPMGLKFQLVPFSHLTLPIYPCFRTRFVKSATRWQQVHQQQSGS